MTAPLRHLTRCARRRASRSSSCSPRWPSRSIVLFATLTTLDTFSSNAARQTRVTDANDQVRAAMDRVVADLRQAATIEVAGANDLVYTVIDSATQTRRERICLDASSTLWRSSVTTTRPGRADRRRQRLPDAGSGAFKVTQLQSVNSAANPMFRYDSRRAVERAQRRPDDRARRRQRRPHRHEHPAREHVRARARARPRPAIDDDDLTTTCNNTGQPTLTLSSGVGPLTVTYTDLDGNALGSADAGSSLS